MTRRKFIKVLAKTGTVIVVGVSWPARATRKFVRAIRLKDYPGSVKPLGDVSKQGKWSG
jgi:DNA topoisomerase VI subunit A